MTLTITAGPTAGHSMPIAAPPPQAAASAKRSVTTVAAQSSAAATAGSTAQQRAALNRMLATYARDQSRGIDARTLSNLGKQILAAAKALGQHVTLPHAPANAGPTVATPVAGAVAEKGTVNVTA